MIEWFRKLSNSWVVRGFFLLLALSFAFLWGGHEAWQRIGLSKEATVATVGGKTITTQDLGLEINRELIRVQLETGKTFTEAEIKEVGLDKQVLQRMVLEKLIELEAKKLGIEVTNEFAAQTIKTSPMFKTPTGEFSKSRFEQVVQHLGFHGEKDYVPYVKKQLLRMRLVSALVNKMPLPAGYLNKLYAWNEQVRSVQVMIIDPKKMNIEGEPSDNDLRDFYGKNQKAFVAPEKRSFQLLLIDGNRFKEGVTINQADVDALYEVHKADKFKDVKPDKAKTIIKAQLEHDKIAEAAQEFAKKLEEEFNSGKSLSDLAAQHKLEFREIKDATRQGLTTENADALYVLNAFEQEEGVLSTLEKGQQGKFYLSYVENISSPKQQSFKEALPEIKERFVELKQQEVAHKLSQTVAQEINKGGFFEAIAHQNNLKIVTVKVNRRNVLPGSPLTFVQQTIRGIYDLDKGQSMIVPYFTPQRDVQILVAKLTDIKNGDASKVSKEDMAKFSEGLQLQMQGDIIEEYLAYLRSQYKVEINPRFFKDSSDENATEQKS
jgi:peptidyl-prolyl cis-trans isomerase D